MVTKTYGKLYSKDVNVTDELLIKGVDQDLMLIMNEVHYLASMDTRITEIDTDDLMVKCDCYNTMHGLKILKKLQAIEGLSDFIFAGYRYAIAVIMHDFAKYSKRKAVTAHIMNLVLKDNYVKLGDHGIESGIFLHSYFSFPPTADSSFVFLHGKKRPYMLDPDKIPPHWMAFFLLDDIIKDPDIYRIKMRSSEYEVVDKFYASPKLTDIYPAFMALREFNIGKMEENE